MEEILANVTVLRKQNGQIGEINAVEHLNGKIVGFYFSAHWCPPCREFTPILRDFYDTVNSSEFEIVFVSLDRTEGDMMDYFEHVHGDWCAIKFGEPLIDELQEKYRLETIPLLIIVRPDGTVASNNARNEVPDKDTNPVALFNKWKAIN